MTNPKAQLAALRALRDAATDPIQQAALDAALTALQAIAPSPSSGANEASTNPVHGHQSNIQGHAQVGVAAAGDIHGDVQSGGVRYEALFQLIFGAAGIAQPDDEQRELLTSYLGHLARRCDRLRLTGVVDWERKRGKAPAFTLSQVYVTLAATTEEVVAEADSAETFSEQQAAGDPDDVLPQQQRRVVSPVGDFGTGRTLIDHADMAEARFVLVRPLLLTEALSRHRRIVLLGGPGSGKSTFLRYLAVALARTAQQPPELPGWSAGVLLPIYASLGGFAAWAREQALKLDGASLWRYLLQQSEGVALDGLSTQLKRAYRAGRVLLLLDGLDEVADPALRVQVAAAVTTLAEWGGFVVVTCRVRSFVDAVAAPLAEWGEPIELAPFTLGQVKHFVRGWYNRSVEQGAFEPEQAAARAGQLIERVAALPNLRELGQTPLLLTIITILHYYEGKLPEDRADLYEDMVQLLLTRWTVQRREATSAPSLLERLKAGGRLGGLKDFHIRSVLEELAYRAHQGARSPDGRGLLELGVVREAFIRLFKQFDLEAGPANEQAELVLTYLEQESGLLQHEGGEQYGLPHLTYEEYLAGCHLAKQKSQPDFRALAYRHWRADSARWREVILLALGRMVRGDDRDTAAAWLQFLLAPSHGERERAADERERAALFAAECLADLGGKPALIGTGMIALAALWDDLARLLAQVVAGTLLPAAERVRAGMHLGALGDPRPGVCTLPPEMVPIAGGTIVLGNTPDEYQAIIVIEERNNPGSEAGRRYDKTVNTQPITIVSFALARYPITNTQYALFIDDDGYDSNQPWWDDAGRAWLQRQDDLALDLDSGQRRRFKDRPELWDDTRFGHARPSQPVVGVSWYEAMAFCRWLSQHRQYNPEGMVYRLPSEAEWEYAARGTVRRIYPWGEDVPEGERANFNDMYGGLTAVGCFPLGATPDGLDDLAGNVWEWTGSVFASYPYDAEDGREDTAKLSQKHCTLRGGGWVGRSINLRTSRRGHYAPDSHFNVVGFRLAQHLTEV